MGTNPQQIDFFFLYFLLLVQKKVTKKSTPATIPIVPIAIGIGTAVAGRPD